MNQRKTKIVAKIADNRSEPEFLRALFHAGADVAWINTAHQGEAETIEVIKKIRSVSATIPIMIDTKGPEVRTKDVEAPIEVKKGDHVVFTGDASQKGDKVIHVTYAKFHEEVPVGEVILYDDALIETVVVEKLAHGIKCVVNNPGLIKNKKSLNVPNVHIALPALTEKDKSFIHFCAKNDIDFITHSFVRSKKDLMEIKAITDQYPQYRPKVIAKIENREGFDNLDEIIEHCEGLMVARGDLGAEVPLPELPYMQKKMLQTALEAGKYCIVATQVLESMIKNPRPTRAEVSDIGNAVLDGTGAMSMSGETAYGDYPVEATTIMGKVMSYTEKVKPTLVHTAIKPKLPRAHLRVARAALKKAAKKEAKAIVTVGCDMPLLRAFSALRGDILVVAGCASKADVRELGMAYGVRGVFVAEPSADAVMHHAKGVLKQHDPVLLLEKQRRGYRMSVAKIS